MKGLHGFADVGEAHVHVVTIEIRPDAPHTTVVSRRPNRMTHPQRLYAGIQLWRERRGAVTLARRFLVLLPFVPLASSIPYAFLPGLTVKLKAVAEGFLYTLIWAVLWYSYLRRSIRVENTFPEAFPAPVRPPESSPTR